MKKGVALVVLGLTSFIAAPAMAATVNLTFGAVGVTTPGALMPSVSGLENFDTRTPVAFPATGPATPQWVNGSATFNVGAPGGSFGIVAKYSDGLNSGQYAPPAGGAGPGNTGNYFSVRPNGDTSTVAFTQNLTQLGLYWGSIDTFNQVEFYKGNSLLATVTGSNVATPNADGDQASPGTNRYVVMTLIGDTFNKIVFRSSGNSFEMDNVAWGPAGAPGEVPLPGALALFAGGLGVMGLLRRRRRKTA